jgi:hypothetical protein
MRGLFGRRKRDDGAAEAPVASNAATAVAEPPAGFIGSDAELDAELARRTEQARGGDALSDQRELIRLRNQAGIRRLGAASGATFAAATATLPEGPGLPEFTRDEVTPELLRSAILRDGCLLVRGLVDRADAEWFAEQIDRSFAERDRHDAGAAHDPELYDEFTPDPRFGEELARPWIKEGGGVLAVDSPLLNFKMMEMFEQARLPELVHGYLGEAPLITAQKTTLRKAEPSVPGAWHQDGKFMGPVRALNLWLSLSRCGDEAPGLDIVPKRIDDFVTTQTDEALLDYMISQRMAEDAAGEVGIQRPIFEPGDALFFDDVFLHKTGSDPAMPKPRYAIENWFFGGSGFPHEYAPIAV